VWILDIFAPPRSLPAVPAAPGSSMASAADGTA
jgi:hypothetical protein